MSPSSTSPSSAAVTFFTSGTSNVSFRNNIFYTTGAVKLIELYASQSNLLFQGNNYYPTGSFLVRWVGNNYSSLAGWQTATGQERLNGANVGFNVNPLLVSPGNGGTIGNTTELAGLSAYRLQAGSPMIDKGLNLFTAFNINPGTRDYYGSVIPQGGGFDIGANEYGGGVVAPTATPAPTPGTCSDADINQSGTVDGADVSILLADFLKTTLTNPRSDVNRNGVADLTDYGVVAKYYLQTCL